MVLDIPNGMLDPAGYTSAELVLHEPDRDVVRSASLVDGAFDFGRIDPSASVAIEATLRNDSGAAVGYGRTSVAAAFAGGAEIIVPVRRPIAYIAGTVSRDIGDEQTTVLSWTEVPATFSDLSIGASLDGNTQLGAQVVMMIAAGPSLYQVTQATSDPAGVLTGAATVTPVSTADHAIGSPLPAELTGSVLDGAGSDDGGTLAIGTSAQLFAVDAAAGSARALVPGSFARVAILASDTGELTAIAIRDRVPTNGPCAATAELWWAPLGAAGAPAHRIATGGFADLATDRGHAYYVDACTGELGEVTESATRALRTIVGKPTALAVSNGQAYVGLEGQPDTTSLVVASLTSADPPRVLWSEGAAQVLEVIDLPEVQRKLDSTSVVISHLEVGAGGDYVALTTNAHFFAPALIQVRFPEMTIDSEELRVFDAATGGTVQRYRSWCDGFLTIDTGDIEDWACATTPGQATAATAELEHHIQSLAFQFGKK